MLYEELLTQISKSGPGYRWIITILIAFLPMKSAFDMFVLNLATAEVPYHCEQAIVDNKIMPWAEVAANYSFAENLTVYNFTCRVPRFYQGSDGVLNLQVANESLDESNKCKSWVFRPDPPERWTMFMEYEMVCDRSYLMNRMQTILQLGICLSTLFGPIGDILGRKPFLVCFCYLDLASNIAVIFVKDLTVQMVLRFFMGFGAPAVLVSIILITELVAEDYRSVHGNLLWLPWVLAYGGSAAISYYIHDWRNQMIAVVLIIGAGYVSYIPVLPESPRWLLTRRKTKRAKRILKEICKFSGCKDAHEGFNCEDNELVKPAEAGDTDEGEASCIFKIIPRDNLCRLEYFVTVSVVAFNLFTVSLVYFALSFQRDFITRDPYLNVLISGVLELPGYFVAWQLTNHAGRKYASVGTMAFCGVGLIVLPYVPVNPDILFQGSSVLAMAIKFSVTIAFSILCVYGSEVLPTKVRSCSFFFACFLMRGAQFLAPEMGGALQSVYRPLPGLLYGGAAVLASLATLLLPETKDRPMPNTVAEMDPIGCHCSQKRQQPNQHYEETWNNDATEEMKPLKA